MASSAYVKWRIVAGALVLAFFFILAGVAENDQRCFAWIGARSRTRLRAMQPGLVRAAGRAKSRRTVAHQRVRDGPGHDSSLVLSWILETQAAAGGGGVVSASEIVFDEVSKFYGEVLGVNRVTLHIPPGITSLVGPNGSGKTTLMNLMTGLIHPDRGTITVRGISPRDPETLMRITGYATQYDAAPRWATGFDFITTGLLLYGYARAEAETRRGRRSSASA